MTSNKMTLEQIRDYLSDNTDLKYFELLDIIESFNKLIDISVTASNDADRSYQSGYDDGYTDGFDNGYVKRCEEDL